LFEGPIAEGSPAIRFTDPLLVLVGYNPLQLSPLPAGYTFLNGNYSVKDSIVEMYYQTLSGKTVKITQRLVTDNETPTSSDMIGASAVVQPVQINGTIGEYVTGSWTLTSPDNPNGPDDTPVYRWHADGEARLRWM